MTVISARRVEAFSDGVFAIAITLLVLGLHDPGGQGDLAGGLTGEWPSLAANVLRGGLDARVAAALYGATMTAMGLVFTAMWWQLTVRSHLLAEGATAHLARASLRRSLMGPLIYVAATAVSGVSAPAALVAYAFVAVYFALPGRSLTPSAEPSDE